MSVRSEKAPALRAMDFEYLSAAPYSRHVNLIQKQWDRKRAPSFQSLELGPAMALEPWSWSDFFSHYTAPWSIL